MTISRQLEEAVADDQGPGYIVRWVTKVDHPEKRNSSFKVRTKDASGTDVQANKAWYPEKARAMSHAKTLLDGEEDFASEFTSSVEVYQKLTNGRTRQIMRKVERERGDDGKVRSAA